MLRFFRQIRHGLLSDNRFGKYALYAVGEITLVVAGILIALQVNNWNEERKLKAEELAILAELKADLEYSKRELGYAIKSNEGYLESYKRIFSYIEKDSAYSVVLDTAFAALDIWAVPYISTTTYETIKSRGMNLISNDSLKKHINQVYNLNIQSLLDDMGRWEWSFSQNTTQRMMVGNIRRSIDQHKAFPNDFERLKRDDEFGNFLSILINIRADNIRYSRNAQMAIERLIASIAQELERRKYP